VTWAPNVGIKESEFKSRWDVDLGVTYIPWDRLPQSLDAIAVGAVVDEDSLPEHMKSKLSSTTMCSVIMVTIKCVLFVCNGDIIQWLIPLWPTRSTAIDFVNCLEIVL